MNSDQMEALWAEQRSGVLAEALGISREDVEQWVIDDYPDADTEGHVVELSDETPPSLVDQLGGTTVKVGPLSFKQGLEGA